MIGKVRLPPRPQLQHFKRPILFQLAQQVHAQTFCVTIIPSIWAALDYFICTIKLIQPKRFNSECLFKRCGEKQSLPESQFNFFLPHVLSYFFLGGGETCNTHDRVVPGSSPGPSSIQHQKFLAGQPPRLLLFIFFLFKQL